VRDWTDVQIRVRGAAPVEGAAPSLRSRHEVEAQKDGRGVWLGESEFDLEKADPSRLTMREYGVELGRQLINPAVERALAYAGVNSGAPVRVRLFLEGGAAALHTICWEKLHVSVEGGEPAPVATSPLVAFSRYIPVEIDDAAPTDDPSLRLLIAVSNPSDLGDPSLVIDVEKELGAFVEEFEAQRMPSRLDVTVLPGRTGISAELARRMEALGWKVETAGVTSLEHVATIAGRRRCHAIHILSHGDFKAGRSQGILYLEDADGKTAKVVDEQLRSWRSPELRLVVLQACRSAVAMGRGDPFVGLAPKLIRFGVPAVVAMQDFVVVEDARAFASAFYRELMEDGFVDEAVNAGRRAIESRGGEWWIPALYQRLTNGKLWSADPVRDSVWETRNRIHPPPGLPEVLPLKVVQERNGIRYNPLEAPSGPIFELDKHVGTLLKTTLHICLTGPSGSNKTEQLQRVYCQLADLFLKDSSCPAPVWLGIAELAKQALPGAVSLFEAAIREVIAGDSMPACLRQRRFVFLVDADEDLGPAGMKLALRSLRGLTDRLNSSCLFVFPESALDELHLEFASAVVLVVRPIELVVLRTFLQSTSLESDKRLRQTIDARGLGDLASAPWLLSQMRDLARFGHLMESRAAVMKLVAENFLSGFGRRGIPRRSAAEALCGLAWAIQAKRSRAISDGQMWKILDEARGSRDFRISELRDALIDANLLFQAGEEAATLSYGAIRSYFAALYLYESPNSQALLEDITASLGRHSRLRHWEEPLIMFAGMQKTTAERIRLLNVLLAGSSLMEGDQVLLAARLYVEMRQSDSTNDPALEQSPVVRQIADTLIWRSRADLGRPYQTRRRALESLASMRHADAVPHLVTLACDKVHMAGDGGVGPTERYDFSGIRLRAVAGLFDLQQQALEYIRGHRPELLELLEAWQKLLVRGDAEPMIRILKANDPSTSAVAAFAFALVRDKFEGDHALMQVFWDESTDPEIIWSITEVLGGMETGWLREYVIQRWMQSAADVNGRLCYLIQKSAYAPEGSEERAYLERCLRTEEGAARAVRALAKVLTSEAERTRLRDLCESILRADWAGAARAAGIPAPDTKGEIWRLQHAALEALRDVGDNSTVDLLRSIRTRLSNTLTQLSFQVGEEIYWRCNGGIAKESYQE